MIVVCSIYAKKYFQGRVLRCTIGSKAGMAQYTDKDCAWMYPEWWMVMGHKAGTVSDQEYKDAYRALMEARIAQVQAWMKALQAEEDLTLVCYCPEGHFCHRRILATMIRHYRPDIEVVIH